MTLGSLFDGISGFPLAGAMNGIKTLWVSEIEPFPCKVSAARFPDAKQLGSVTDIDGGKIEPVDIITFGSPCQDLSVAGKQKGIHDGERSNLFFEAVRIIKEMRDADAANGRTGEHIRPRFAVWENVPGAFSSNRGADFRAVLEALAGVRQDGLHIPRPAKWNHAGGVAGDGWSLAWRVYDAQYWGVPQRRKRIYLVADFAGERAHEILFERESVCGDSSEGGAAREGTADDAERGVGGSGGVRCLNPWDSQSIRQYDVNGIAPNINANSHGGQNRWGVCYAIQGNGIDRSDTAGCNGCGWRVNEMYTLNTIDRPAVVFPETARSLCARHDSSPCGDRGQNVVAIDCRNMVGNEELSATLQAKSGGGTSLNYVNPICYRSGGYGGMVEGVGTLRANGGDAGGGYGEHRR